MTFVDKGSSPGFASVFGFKTNVAEDLDLGPPDSDELPKLMSAFKPPFEPNLNMAPLFVATLCVGLCVVGGDLLWSSTTEVEVLRAACFFSGHVSFLASFFEFFCC